MRAAADDTIQGSPVRTVEVLSQRYALMDSDRDGILDHLIRGGDLTRYGVLNAFTRHAQDVQTYEHSTRLEELGGKILDLNPTEWESVSA